jgi:hypothetical protein
MYQGAFGMDLRILDLIHINLMKKTLFKGKQRQWNIQSNSDAHKFCLRDAMLRDILSTCYERLPLQSVRRCDTSNFQEMELISGDQHIY